MSQLSPKRPIVVIAAVSLSIAVVSCAALSTLGVTRLLRHFGATPEVAETRPFPTLSTATPTLTPTHTATPVPTGTPTAMPTPTPTFTPTPTPTPTPRVITLEVRSLGRLETAKFLMQTVIDREQAPSNVWEDVLGTDKLLLVAEGEVVAGFDMTRVAQEDILVQGDRVSIALPPPEILYTKVDNDRTYVYERRTGLFRRPDKDIESEARRLAERAMLDHALEGQILDQAESTGRLLLEAFLHSLGFTDVTIVVQSE